jgi:hypothetical protein
MKSELIDPARLREHVLGLVRASFENTEKKSVASRSYVDELLISFLKNKREDPSLRREVIGFLRCFTAFDARLIGELDLVRKERLEFFKYFDYEDHSILAVRRILDKLVTENSNEDIALWFASLEAEELVESTPEGLLREFIRIAFHNAQLFKQ